jgi:hypothetical protein
MTGTPFDIYILRGHKLIVYGCKDDNLIVFTIGYKSSLFEGLILAQDERWRRALGMQVER